MWVWRKNYRNTARARQQRWPVVGKDPARVAQLLIGDFGARPGR
ncbi:hypothetical protein AIOL_003324 [Candidatus Rhodobacter oscarellae]|uniref:Uncharacterized protein n=1 Tax=Candidatus Rhodobacter oscarellae TaxID=1675527 RepID=A0A0J9E6Q9_9RHOB|nr:hypothetical protein AIOL_003324 [Candidatus Rhodobacter lobularis]